jgi:dihydrodipicolinate synthase/N-acetylneuraminate lyase
MLEKLIIPVLIFFNSNKKVDIKANSKYIELLNNSPFKKIILFGSTSEGMLISLKEKLLILDMYTTYLKKDIDIFVSPSVFSIKDFVKVMNYSDRVRDILFLPNCYFNRKEGDLINYMKTLFNNSNKKIYIYNLPKNTLVNIFPKDINLFRQNNLKIKGIKLSHSEMKDIKLYKSINNFIVMYGSDKNILEAFKYGADFIVSQSLSPIFFTVNENNIIKKIDYVRNYIKQNSSNNKIFILKTILNNIDPIFPKYTLI